MIDDAMLDRHDAEEAREEIWYGVPADCDDGTNGHDGQATNQKPGISGEPTPAATPPASWDAYDLLADFILNKPLTACDWLRKIGAL